MLGPEEVQKPGLSLLVGAIESTNPFLRCVAAEGFARLAQILNEPNFTVSLMLMSFDKWVSANFLCSFIFRNIYFLFVSYSCNIIGGIMQKTDD